MSSSDASTADGSAAPLRALILQHEEPTPPGLVTEWLDGHGASIETLRIDVENREVDPAGYDLIVSLGSEFAAFDDTKPFVPREATLMRRAVEADVPVLGLCFGGQMLARVLGEAGPREGGLASPAPQRQKDEMTPPWRS